MLNDPAGPFGPYRGNTEPEDQNEFIRLLNQCEALSQTRYEPCIGLCAQCEDLDWGEDEQIESEEESEARELREFWEDCEARRKRCQEMDAEEEAADAAAAAAAEEKEEDDDDEDGETEEDYYNDDTKLNKGKGKQRESMDEKNLHGKRRMGR